MILRPKHAVVIRVTHRAAMRGVAESGRRIALDAAFEPVAIAEPEHRPSATVILDEAQSRGVSVIVIASHGHSTKQPALLGDVSSILVRRSHIPLLVVPPGDFASPATEPVFACYDGSGIARQALVTAAGVLAGRTAIVAAFVPSVDDSPLLSSNLPWPVDAEMEDRLARIDREEGEVPVRRAADGGAYSGGGRIRAATGRDPGHGRLERGRRKSVEAPAPGRRKRRGCLPGRRTSAFRHASRKHGFRARPPFRSPGARRPR